jgi:signal transduction histidine kinase
VQLPAARALRLERVSLVVLVVGLLATLGAFLLAREWVARDRENALADQAARTADVIQTFSSVSQNAVDVASAISEAADGDPEKFETLMEARLRDPGVASVTLFRVEGQNAVALASAGPDTPVLVPGLGPVQRAVVAGAARTGAVSPVAVATVEGERVALVAGPGTTDERYAVAVEFRLGVLDQRFKSIGSDDIEYALYAGPVVAPATLVMASTDDLPLTGPAVTESIEVLGRPATLVVVAADSLVGGFLAGVQWLVLGVGLVLTGVATLLVEAGRRRIAAARERLALQDQNVRLLELDRLKDELIATVSHELRTPLTSIIGYGELLLEGDPFLEPEQRGFVEIIERNARRLLNLVNDLLFIARYESGEMSLQHGEVDLAEVVSECVDAARAPAGRAGVAVSLTGTDSAPVCGDGERLCQLVDNLVSNAIKFTPQGGRVDVRLERDGSHAVLTVTDTGIGIPREEQDRLFERFFRSSTAVASAIQGTGLGLVICKAIAEAHGGTITAVSEDGAGSSFRVELPLAPVKERGALDACGVKASSVD